MKKNFTDKRTGISYTLQGDYYLPDLELPAEEQQPIGVWGQRHLRHIKQHCKVLYTNLLASGKLSSYLADINQQAEEMISRLVKEYAEKEYLTEQLKADNQMVWVQKMNNIRNCATEIINNEVIFR